MIANADAAGITVRSQRLPERRGGSVVFGVADDDGMSVVQELDRRGIVVDFRPGAGVRVAPHFYSTEDEIDFTVHELADILHAGR